MNMSQAAPFPEILLSLVGQLSYRPNWRCKLKDIDRGQGSSGLTFIVTTVGFDTYNVDRGEHYRVNHYFPVPPAAYDERSWKRWLLEQLILVETHEACEFFQIGDERPFAPNHGPGRNPYDIVEYSTDEDRRTKYTGEVNQG